MEIKRRDEMTKSENIIKKIRNLKLKKYKIDTEIVKLEKDLNNIQKNCKHENIKLVYYGSEFDGYDRSEKYWKVYCPDCKLKKTTYDKYEKFNDIYVFELEKLK